MSKSIPRLCSALGVLLMLPLRLFAADAQLETGFKEPPNPAKPRTLWMWMNGNVTPGGITLDLEAMQRVGLGGALIFNIGEFIPKGPIDYGQPPWIELMVHAAREADRLGLELAMHNCPGWSSSGGPWITPEMSMQRLVWSETRIQGGAAADIVLQQPFTRLDFYRDIRVVAFPTLPGEEKPFPDLLRSVHTQRGTVDKRVLTDGDLVTSLQIEPGNPLVLEFAEPFTARAVTVQYSSGGATVGFTLESSDDGTNFTTVAKLKPASPRAIEDASLVATFEPLRARFFRIIPARTRGICEIELHAAPRIDDWNFKANHVFRAARWDALPNPVPTEFAIPPDRIIDLTDRMDASGRLRWEAPAGNWTVLRFGHTSRGQENIAAPDAGVGLEVDKMSRRATAFHFEHGLGPLLNALGPLAGKSFKALEVDSHEVGVQNWTSGFENAFRDMNGYEIARFLPAMTGRFVESATVSEKFLWDLRRTHAQLVADCYYGELRAIANRHGLRVLAEPYGAGPGSYDELQIAGRVDVPMGEFWAHFPWDDMMSVRLAASAAHVLGKPVVAAEAFTATVEQSRFMDYPFGLKSTGDLAFSLGLNQMYFHRYAHQPHPSAVPGMTMGPWGFNFDRNNSWFEQAGPWLSHLARCQFLLQQGDYVADVLCFSGEGSPQISKRIVPELPRGFQFDVVDAETLLACARVVEGRVHLNTRNGYRLIALPPNLNAMTPDVLRKLHALVKDGAVLVGQKPEFSPTLRGSADAGEFDRLVAELWTSRGEHPARVGNGRVYSTSDISRALQGERVQPAFRFVGEKPDASLAWLHRRTGDSEVYFVANRQRRPESVVASFRIAGKEPELWFPETGEIRTAAVFETDERETKVPLELKPAESVFVVFRNTNAAPSVAWISRNGVPSHAPGAFVRSRETAARLTQWTNDFTICAWIKPDTDLMLFPREGGAVAENGKSWVVPVPGTNALAADGRAAVGIAAGRNGVIVAEQTAGRSVATLVSRKFISGWTHLAVVWRGGKPALYLNGMNVSEGIATGAAVHPAVGYAPAAQKIVYYFDGDMTEPEVHREAMNEVQIAEAFHRGLPAPSLPGGIEVWRQAGKLMGHAWEAGDYQTSGSDRWQIDAVPAPVNVPGPWTLMFPTNSGAPETLVLTQLQALQTLPDPNVRHFGGTVIYRTQFEFDAQAIANERRLWMDLGRVAVIARVRVNGVDCGPAWKPPFRVEITGAARAGTNLLEVEVTTLLANRLIGDEALPAENEYDSRNGAIRALPEWYVAGISKPGGRTTFSTWRFFNSDEPLLEAGMRGPVRVLTSVTGEFVRRE